MPAVSLYFQVHQPFRLRKFSFFEAGTGANYFDDGLNELVMKRAAERCYLPANEILLEAVKQHGEDFKVAFSITGTALEQMQLYAPAALDSFRKLADTGQVEFLAETHYHSLAALYSLPEFERQVRMHRETVRALLGQEPSSFRNTELLYSDDIAERAAALGFKAVLAEGADSVLGWRSPNAAFCAAGSGLPLLLRNYRLSDDIGFRFGNGEGLGRPLTAKEFARRLSALPADADTVGLFLDYETFGEHQYAESTILRFLSELPRAVLSIPSWSFTTPTESAQRSNRRDPLSIPQMTSWADSARDTSAWNGNSMQQSCISRLYALEERVLKSGDAQILEIWSRLQASDHVYYISTKGGGDGSVHSYFSPFDSPYDAFIAFMNVVRDLENRLE